ncbi:MAG: hypothetical protein JO129_01695 [Candidatus Dependentiae bacterium]|nr:hypothetical protein [Candidatus Dependentiae bacterium]
MKFIKKLVLLSCIMLKTEVIVTSQETEIKNLEKKLKEIDQKINFENQLEELNQEISHNPIMHDDSAFSPYQEISREQFNRLRNILQQRFEVRREQLVQVEKQLELRPEYCNQNGWNGFAPISNAHQNDEA